MVEDYSVSSANLSRAALSSLYEYLRKLGLPIENVWKHVRERHARVQLAERILTEDQVRALILAAEPGVPRLLVRWLYYTGCRASEVVGVRGRDLRRTPQGAWVLTILGKGGKTRWVRLPDRLVAELAHVVGWPPPREERFFHLTRQQVYRIVTRAAQRAGLPPGVSPHWLRHAHISHALDHGVPIHVVQQEVGHSSVAITDRYIHVAPGAGSADALPWV